MPCTSTAKGAEPGLDPLAPLVEALEQGESLVIFPEGTRNAKGIPQDFKSGLFHLARKFPQVQLIPAWIDNVQRVMPKGEVVPVPILCTVTFGAPCNLAPDETKADFPLRRRRHRRCSTSIACSSPSSHHEALLR